MCVCVCERERERERMGRSKSGCLRIITCGRGDTAADDDHDDGGFGGASRESKVSSDKRRWSFRKKSPAYLAPSTVLSEPVRISSKKEISAVIDSESHSPKSSSGLAKDPPKDTENNKLLVSSSLVQSEALPPLLPDKNFDSSNQSFPESVVIIIQASIRSYLVRREVNKVKNAIKLQAAVRGHLVRRQAVGTLHCIQGIIKLQAIIRARRAYMFPKELDGQKDNKLKTDMPSSEILGKEISSSRSDKKLTSANILLSNKFARKLFESTPSTKPIYINCDHSKSDLAWKWLERWMTVALPDWQEGAKNIQNFQIHEENSKPSCSEAVLDNKQAQLSESSDSKLAPYESSVPAVTEIHQVPNPETGFDSVVKGGLDQSPLENEPVDLKQEKDKEICVHIEKYYSSLSQMPLERITSDIFHDCVSDMPEPDGNPGKLNMEVTNDTGNMIFDSKMGMTSSADDSGLDTSQLQLDSPTKNKDLFLEENSFSHLQAASGCGTEISISSTLDSPERSDAEGEIILDLVSLGKQENDTNNGPSVLAGPRDTEEKDHPFHEEVEQPEKLEKQLPEMTESDTQSQNGKSLDQHTDQLSTAGISKSQDKKTKKKKESGKSNEIPSYNTGNKLRSNSTKDSGRKSNVEQLQTDARIAKRQNSLGTEIAEHVDQEPTTLSTSSSLPSYMQATVSARAKAHGNISPKAIPELHEKDACIKKRQSLPIANGMKDLSPRLQRSSSQAHQSPKGNGVHAAPSSADRRWQR